MICNKLALLFFGISISLTALPTFADMPQVGEVKILAPGDGQNIHSDSYDVITYEIILGPGADHGLIYVDGNKLKALTSIKGEVTIPPMKAGKHSVCIKEAKTDDSLTGVEKCITINTSDKQ